MKAKSVTLMKQWSNKNYFFITYIQRPFDIKNPGVYLSPDMRIVAGTAGMPEEPPKKNTLKIKFLFASQ